MSFYWLRNMFLNIYEKKWTDFTLITFLASDFRFQLYTLDRLCANKKEKRLKKDNIIKY